MAEEEAVLEVMRLQESIAEEERAEQEAEVQSREHAAAVDEAEARSAEGHDDATSAESVLNRAPRHSSILNDKKFARGTTAGPRGVTHRARFGEVKSSSIRSKHTSEGDDKENDGPTYQRTSIGASSDGDETVGGDFSRRMREALEAKVREEEQAAAARKGKFSPFFRVSDSLGLGFDDDSEGSDADEGSAAYLNRRFRVARKYSRPVEVILDMTRCPEHTHYDLLGVSPTASPTEIKQAYRLKSLEVHPDKNPHPDAKVAFDALVASYELLSNEEERQRYDEKRAVVCAARNPFKISNIKLAVVETLDNAISRLLLFLARIRRGDWRDELEEATESLRALDLKRRYTNFFRHYVLLPSWPDRFALAGEQIWDQRYKLLSVLLSSIALKSILGTPASSSISDIATDYM